MAGNVLTDPKQSGDEVRESGFSRRSAARATREEAEPQLQSGRFFDWAAQTLVLCGIGYAVLFGGATEPGVQFYVCLAVLAALVVSLLRPQPIPFPRPKLTAAILCLWLSWLAISAIQSVHFSAAFIEWLSPSTNQVRVEYSGTVDQASQQTLSLVPYLTRLAWANFSIGIGFFLIGATVWGSRKSKTWLLTGLTLGIVAFSLWGLVQRAHDSREVLPGVPAPEGAAPFATLVYKNASASLLIAGIAVGVGLLLVSLRPALRQKGKRSRQRTVREEYSESFAQRGGSSTRSKRSSRSSSDTGYSTKGYWTEPNVVISIVLLATISLGLVATLSRGGCVAAVIAVATWAGFLRKYVSPKTFVAVATTVVLLGGAGVFTLGLRKDVAVRAGQSDFETLSNNDRFGHWADAAETVWDYPILGSGLGTYGYAQLVNQDIDSPRWFHHAHNQFLEWTVEFGVLGVVAMVLACCVLFWLLRDLYLARKKGTTPLIWFSVLVIAVTGVMLQSIWDFVLLTPAVLWVYALLLGVATSAVPDSSKPKNQAQLAKKRGARIKTVDGGNEASWFASNVMPRLGRPFVWTLLVACALLIGQRWLQDEILDQSILRTTRVPRNLTPSLEMVESSRARLIKRAQEHPINGRLWQRLAAWDVAKYRLELIKMGEADGETLKWSGTSPANLFQVLHSMTPESRQATLDLWLVDEVQKDAVAAAKQHYAQSIRCNPLVPQVHLQVALMAPFFGEDYEPFARISRDLSVSNGNLQFANGLLALGTGDIETMTDQWRRCLRYKPENLLNVLRLASTVLTPKEITDDILCDLRSNVWVSLARRSHDDESLEPFRVAFLDGAKRAVRDDRLLPNAERHFYLAQMSEYEGKPSQAEHQYGEAVKAAPSNANFRYRYALALLLQGKASEAREAAALGRALDSEGKRWQVLIERIDRELVAASKSDSASTSEKE